MLSAEIPRGVLWSSCQASPLDNMPVMAKQRNYTKQKHFGQIHLPFQVNIPDIRRRVQAKASLAL